MAARERHRLEITGAVQGVGFRPFVYRLARELGLCGWVSNSQTGLVVEIEGSPEACAALRQRIRSDAPPRAAVREMSGSLLPPKGESTFVIRESEDRTTTTSSTEIIPDLATCPDCVREIFDASHRRFHYPFTNCTQCGPRFSIVRSLPYDRERTTMAPFPMCPACREEYESPDDRRFHAQPIACPDCGPQISFTDGTGRIRAHRGEALENAALAIESGQIVAVKGIGGFHLIVDARYPDSIETLRARKHRPAKALAVMMPNLARVRAHCEISSLEESLLTSPAAPIVILQRRADYVLPTVLAPGNPTLGVMLPYTPLHHLLMDRLGFPVVVTSGNLSDEPLCTDNDEAYVRLRGIADAFLVHDRAIARPIDDSVLRVASGRELMLRCSRGFTPLTLEGDLPPVLAVGGDQKTSLAVSGPWGIRCGQHIGDLDSDLAQRAFLVQCQDFPSLNGVKLRAITCDWHPGYHSVRMATEMDLPVLPVQHHHAHIAACLAEHRMTGEVLGVAWDGTGYGTDGTIWGGEFLIATGTDFERFAWLRPFPLPGGELAIRQPRYAALGLLHEAGIELAATPLATAFSDQELAVARVQLERRLLAPLTSSAGRLFDVVAALTGLRWRNDFEAQAALELEWIAGTNGRHETPFQKQGQILDWEPTIRAVLADLNDKVPVPTIAARFLEAISNAILLVAREAERKTVVLTGGCFQNTRLLETTIAKLHEAGFLPVWPHLLPPNDGGLAAGQAFIAARRLQTQSLGG